MRTLKTWLCACLMSALFAACFPIAAAAQQGIAAPPAGAPGTLITHAELFNTALNGGTLINYNPGQAPGLAYDAGSGDIYFAEALQIVVIHSNGTISTLPAPSGYFGNVTALAFYNGNLYAADGSGSYTGTNPLPARNLIWQYIPSSSTWSQIVTSVNNPTGIAFDSSGNLYVASWDDKTVYEYPYNSASQSFGSGNIFWTTTDSTAAPYAIAFDQLQQYLYICGFGIANGTKIFRASLTGTSTVYFDSLAADPSGAFFSDTQGGNQYTGPTSLAFDSNDYLYIGYYNALKIVRIAPNGTSIAVFPGGGSADDAPNGLAVTPQGDVITVVTNGNSTSDGNVAVIRVHGTGPSMNAAADFSPTVNRGPWSYGDMGTLSSGIPFAPLSSRPNVAATDFIANLASPYGLDFWVTNPLYDSPRLDPDIIHNGGASTLTPFCCAVIPPNGLGLQPGPTGSPLTADVRWTALFSGQYLVFGIWSGLDFSGPTSATGLTIINSTIVSSPSYSINSFGPLSSNPITPYTTLSPNGTIDFNVTAVNNNDVTGLDAVVVQAGDTAPLSINANSVWFVTQPVGTSAGSTTLVTIANGSVDAQTIGPLQLVGANASDFQISGDSCSNTMISAGGTCTFTTSLLPSALGARTAFILATSTDNITAQVASEQFPMVGIGVANTTVSLSSSSNPILWESGNVTYTATVTSPIAGNVVGSVQFYDGQTLLASVPLSGSSASYAQTAPTAGLHAIAAVFVPGNTTFVGISSASIQEAVATPVSIFAASATTFYVGQAGSFQIGASGTPAPAITLTAGTLPSGLTFTDYGGGFASITGTPATGTNGTYNLTITAANALNSITQAITLTVTGFQSISLAPIPGHFVDDAPFAVSATASSGLSVALTASGNCTITGNMVTITSAGSCTITATQPGDSNFGAATPVSQSFNIVVHPAPCPANITSSVFVTSSYTGTANGAFPFFGGEGAGITTDPAGNVYVALNPFPFQTASSGYFPGATPAVLMISADGLTQTLLTPPGGFGEVTAVAFYNGSLYVADGIGYKNTAYTQATAYNAIWQYNPGTGAWSEPIGVNNPTGIAFWNGNIYVSSWTDQSVYAFSPAGAFLGTVWTAPDPTAAPYGLAFDQSGDLFIAGFGGSGSSGTGTKIFEVAAADVAIYRQNYSVFLDPGINEPASLAFDAFGNLFASYYDAGQILRITPNGSYSTAVNTAAPNGIAFDVNNNLFAMVNVSNIGGQVIKIQGVICSPFTPLINWPSPAPILYGTALSATQLDATAVDASNNTIAGTFTYTPPAGTVPNPGTQTLSVTFAPTDTADYLSATASAQLTVNQPPTITSAATTTFVVGSSGSFTATASGYPAAVFTESGTLPTGVTLSPAGVLSGTAAAGSGGVYNITITALNGTSPNATQAFTLTVNEAPSITSAASTAFTAGTLGSFSLTATGYPAPTFSETGTLLGNVTLSSSGVLSGTPPATSGGVYTITVTATNAVSSYNQNFTLTVDQAPAFSSAAATTFAVGSAGSFAFTATGYPAATFSEVGALPSSVTLSSSGVLSGTSATGTGGTYAITVTASNGTSPNATQAFTLTVTDTPTGASVVVTPIDTSKKTTPVTLTFATVSKAGYTSLTTTSSGPALPVGFTAGSPIIYYNLSTTAGYSGLITMSIDFTGTTFTTTPHLLHYDPVAGAWTDITTLLSGSIIHGSVSSLSPFTVAEETPTLPSVTTNPVSQTATAGSNVTFTSAATGNPTPTVQWQVSAGGGSFTNLSGATSTTLTLTGLTASMNGNQYQAVFTNSVGSATTTAATLTVNFAPSVTTSPASQTVTAGSNVTFTSAATGNPTPTVQWQVSANGGASYTNLAGATSTTLTLTGVTASQNGYLYQAVFTNSVGSATTGAATLTVNSAPTVTTNPVSQNVTAGSNVTFTAAATGNPMPTVQWQVSINGGTSYASIPGATSTTLTLTGVITSQNGYMYLAVFTNSVGSATSTAATLTVNSANSTPVVTTNPVSQTVPLGSSVTFTAAATGNPTPTVQWQFSTNGGAVFTNISGATSTTLMLTAVAASMNGNQYRAVFTNTAGSATTLPATLTVSGTSPAPAITSASSTAFPIGVSSSFTVTTTGTPTPKITISMTTESPTLPAGVTFVDNGNGTATLSGTPAAKMQNYSFTITASNGVKPNATQKFTLTVGEAPMFTSSASTVFAINTATTFTIKTSGFPAAVITESGALPTGIAFTTYTNGTATLSGTSSASGTYPITLTATNTLGSAQQAFTLTLGVAPAITSLNKTQFTVAVPGSFTVTTTGIPNPHLSISATAKLPSGVTFVDNGNGTATLSGTPAAGTGGKYTFTITATDGVSPKATQSFTLTVNPANQPPAITSANSASFTVGVSGPTFTITTSGFPTVSVTKMGTLPKGLSFTPHSNGTATISGTPAGGTAGTYSLTVTASNGVLPNATQVLTVTVH
jgi:sugar lactone lactonase YvrE